MEIATGNREENISPFSEEDTSPVINGTSAPLNFCELTPCDFGISAQSFAPSSTSHHKDKSRLAQIKARRRSSVGVRGSPVTNSLICFMAKQKMVTPPTPQSPELVRSSPLLPRVASTLRQKMASFQTLMAVEESDASDPLPTQDSNTGGCIKTRDYLSDGSSHGGGKENNPPLMVTPSKRRRLGPLKGCSVEIREASTPILHYSQNEQEDGGFELQMPGPPLGDPSATILPHRSTSFQITSLPSLLEMKSTGEDESTGASTVKKKRVRFGGPLSPEFFDKNLPPSTPLQKGGTPALAPTPGGRGQLRSLLKTPQQKTPQPDLLSPTVLGSSPILSIPRHGRMPSKLEEEDKDGKILFPSIESLDSPVTSDTECTWDAQPLNLNMAFHEESLSQTVTESDTQTNAPSQTDVPNQPLLCPEETQPEAHIEAPAPPNRRKKPATEEEPTSKTPAHPNSRKRKLSEESEPVRRSTRSAAKSASGKMKLKTTRQWSKDVDRSLYGSREHACKNPTLSPITENLSFIGQSPAESETPISCTAQNQETPEITPPNFQSKSTIRKGGRLTGQGGRRRGMKKRKVSVADSHLLSEELCEDQTSTSPQLAKDCELEQEEIDTEKCSEKSAELFHTGGDSECHASLHASNSVCLTPVEESNNTDTAQRKARRGRRRSVKCPVLQNHTEENQSRHDLEEQAEGEHAAVQQENIQSASDLQEHRGAANANLASWQADFNFEDVFKPVAARGQRSVRRSLRNQSTKHSGDTGLAWVTPTSPAWRKEARRMSRGPQRRMSLPVQPPHPADTQDAS